MHWNFSYFSTIFKEGNNLKNFIEVEKEHNIVDLHATFCVKFNYQCRAPSTIIDSLQLSALINISPRILIWRLSCIFSFAVTSRHAPVTSLSSSLHCIRILNIARAKNLEGPSISGNKKMFVIGANKNVRSL